MNLMSLMMLANLFFAILMIYCAATATGYAAVWYMLLAAANAWGFESARAADKDIDRNRNDTDKLRK